MRPKHPAIKLLLILLRTCSISVHFLQGKVVYPHISLNPRSHTTVSLHPMHPTSVYVSPASHLPPSTPSALIDTHHPHTSHPLPSPPSVPLQMSALEVEGQALKALLEAEGKLPSSASRGTAKVSSQTKGLGLSETGLVRAARLPTSSSGVTQVDGCIDGDTGQCPQWCYDEASMQHHCACLRERADR